MTLFHDLDFNLSNLRQFPNAKHRKKIKEILKEGRKAKQDRATAEAGALASDTAGAHGSNKASAQTSDTSSAHCSNTASAHGSNTASACASNTASDTASAHASSIASDAASAHASGNVDDKADSICWFCHGDVTNLENNKCAGCRKVTQLRLCSLEILKYKTIFSGSLL